MEHCDGEKEVETLDGIYQYRRTQVCPEQSKSRKKEKEKEKEKRGPFESCEGKVRREREEGGKKGRAETRSTARPLTPERGRLYTMEKKDVQKKRNGLYKKVEVVLPGCDTL